MLHVTHLSKNRKELERIIFQILLWVREINKYTIEGKNHTQEKNTTDLCGSTFKTYVCKCKHKLRENSTKK